MNLKHEINFLRKKGEEKEKSKGREFKGLDLHDVTIIPLLSEYRVYLEEQGVIKDYQSNLIES